MSGDYTTHNLLTVGSTSGYRMGAGIAWPGYAEKYCWTQRAACTPGKTYTLVCDATPGKHVCFGFYKADGSFLSRPRGYVVLAATSSGLYHDTETAPDGAAYVAASWTDGERKPMVVEGSTPVAWAPAAGETLSGGGVRL